MKRLLLVVPFALAACGGDLPTRLTAPGAPAASRSGDDESAARASSGTVVVSPANMHGWSFRDDNTDGPCLVTSCRMVVGPETPPLGVGSAELATNAPGDRNYLGLFGSYAGVAFGDITALAYSTYRQSPPTVEPSVLAIALQFNVDYDLRDANTTYQGRVVFEPYYTGTPVLSNVWQSWNALEGRGWWSSSPAFALAANPTSVPCTQPSPCTFAELVSRYPNAGINQVAGGILLKTGGGWPPFRGNTDAFTIGVSGTTTTYDFEPYATPASKDDCKNDGWRTVRRADGSSFRNQGDCVSYSNGSHRA